MNTALVTAIEAALALAKADTNTPTPTAYTGPCLAGFLAARAQTPPDGTYPSAWTWVQAQAQDTTNSLTQAERDALFGATIRFGGVVGRLPATMPYSEVLFRFLHPETYNAVTGAIITEADRERERRATQEWDEHWKEKEKQQAATLPAGWFINRAALLAAHPNDAITLDGKLIQAGFGNPATGDPWAYKSMPNGIAPA